MPTVTKTWSFASDNEGLDDAGNAAGIAVAFQGADSQSGSGGCLRWNMTTKGQTQTEFARRATTGETWESWGVPAGATVTTVQVTAWYEKLQAKVKLSSHSFAARVIGSGGATVHSAGDLISGAQDTNVDAAWQARGAGTARAVDSGSQASTTDVRLELEYTITTSGGGGSANEDWRVDEIALEITYTAGVTSFAGTCAATSSASGALSVSRPLSGTAAAASSLSGAVGVTRDLAGTSPAVASATGTSNVARAVAGTLASVAAMSGALTVQSGGEVSFAGTMAATASATASLSAARPISGTSSASASASGAIGVQRGAIGSLPALSAVGPAPMAVPRPLAGALGASAAFDGALSTAGEVTFAGAMASTSSVAGALTVPRPFAGAITSASTVDAALSVSRRAAGNVVAASSLAGGVLLTRGMGGTCDATSGVLGLIAASRPFAGTIAAAASFVGAIAGAGELPFEGALRAHSHAFADLYCAIYPRVSNALPRCRVLLADDN